MKQFSLEDIAALIESFDDSNWDELRVKADGFELYLSTDPADRHRRTAAPPGAAPSNSGALSAGGGVQPVMYAPPSSPSASSGAPPAALSDGLDIPAGHVVVRAAILGTFYRAPKPGAKPFVDVGERVEPTSDICVIEVMKLFTVVQAAVSGVVRKVLVNDAELVEFDQPLFLIELAR